MTKNTIFAQLTNFISPFKVKRIAEKFGNDKYVKKFTTLEQFKALLFAQIKGFSGLRESIIGLKSRCSRLYHLGFKTVITKSTLSDANNKRDHRAYREMFFHVLTKCKSVIPKHKFNFKKEFYSLDATTIGLCLTLCKWAKFRTTKSGIKIHTFLNHCGYIPEFIWLKPANQHDSVILKDDLHQHVRPNSIIVMDKAYVSFKPLYGLTQKDVTFVTRAKDNMQYKIIERNSKIKSKGIIFDRIVALTGFCKAKDYPEYLRLVKYKDKETGNVYVFMTNNFTLCAKTIANCYKERWQIELFFKWIKQNLKIKKFMGNSENAVYSQIWVALIYYLILSYHKYKNKWSQSLLDTSRVLREIVREIIPIDDIFEFKRKHEDLKFMNPSQTQLFKPILTGH